MKPFVIAICCVLTFMSARAQGTLEFNQVKYIEISVVANGSYFPQTVQSFTVPAGKVWKIESALVGYRIGHSTSGGARDMINSSILGLNNRVLTDGTLTAVFPIWLPEGTYELELIPSCDNCLGNYNSTNYGSISAIEFNVN